MSRTTPQHISNRSDLIYIYLQMYFEYDCTEKPNSDLFPLIFNGGDIGVHIQSCKTSNIANIPSYPSTCSIPGNL